MVVKLKHGVNRQAIVVCQVVFARVEANHVRLFFGQFL